MSLLVKPFSSRRSLTFFRNYGCVSCTERQDSSLLPSTGRNSSVNLGMMSLSAFDEEWSVDSLTDSRLRATTVYGSVLTINKVRPGRAPGPGNCHQFPNRCISDALQSFHPRSSLIVISHVQITKGDAGRDLRCTSHPMINAFLVFLGNQSVVRTDYSSTRLRANL